MKYGKWLAGGLGWVLGGPIGALIGLALGSLGESKGFSKRGTTTQGDFALTFVVLTASVMKADGKVLRLELDFVKKAYVKFFGVKQAGEMILILRDVLKQDINLYEVCTQIKQHMNYPSKLQCLHFLYGIAQADGQIVQKEADLIYQIAQLIGLSTADTISIKNMYIKDNDSAYKILEIDRTASNEEIKKAYKKLAIKYHPDKVSYLGEEARKQAEEQFKKLNEAYESIKKERGIK